MMVDGASFIESFHTLNEEYHFPQRFAYTIAMRTYRGGGLTKDAVYLRGLMEILEYLSSDGELEPLFIGKIAVEHISLIQELRHRKILNAPVLRPRYLEMPGVSERLQFARKGIPVLELIQGKTK